MQGISLNYHGDQTIPLGTEHDTEQFQQIYNFLLHILAYHAHITFFFFNYLPIAYAHLLLLAKNQDKMLTISSPKTKHERLC